MKKTDTPVVPFSTLKVVPSIAFVTVPSPLAPEDIVFPAERTNLVIVIAESFEDTFTDEGRLGTNLVPRLTAFRDRSLSFRGKTQLFGLGCTRMAQCAMLYGIPTVSYSFVSNPFSEEFGRQIPCRIPSLFALLSDEGYAAAYVQGGSMDFVDTRGLFGDVPDLVSFERKVIERSFATFDWAPTFLDLIGWRIPEGRMGLGVSLLEPNARTLLERFGAERINLEVRRYDQAFEALAYPDTRD